MTKNLVVLNVLKLTWRDWGQQNKPCKVHCEANQIDRPHFWSDIGVAVEHLCEMADMFSKKLSRRAFFITNQSMDETKYDFCMSLEVLNVWFSLYKRNIGMCLLWFSTNWDWQLLVFFVDLCICDVAWWWHALFFHPMFACYVIYLPCIPVIKQILV